MHLSKQEQVTDIASITPKETVSQFEESKVGVGGPGFRPGSQHASDDPSL